ncbi:MAG TPA: cytochrome c3 family protein [Tepidisphaeraceae bacterium]|nr:cytochrome c3 family protein [Tepidisphaeraceae bacterium]
MSAAMARVFHPLSHTVAKASIFGLIFLIGGGVWAACAIERSPYVTDAGVYRTQPVPFSHKHHVLGLGLDCRYCHTSVQDSSFAGLPPTKTCMTCHSKIWTNAAILEPVRESWRTNTPIHWQRVNNLPDFVYFNHSIHVAKGIGCSTCHGRVDEMPLTFQAASLQMEWCLTCHRHPERFIRPRSQIFNMAWTPPPNQEQVGTKLAHRYNLISKQLLQNCSLCHR